MIFRQTGYLLRYRKYERVYQANEGSDIDFLGEIASIDYLDARFPLASQKSLLFSRKKRKMHNKYAK